MSRANTLDLLDAMSVRIPFKCKQKVARNDVIQHDVIAVVMGQNPKCGQQAICFISLVNCSVDWSYLLRERDAKPKSIWIISITVEIWGK